MRSWVLLLLLLLAACPRFGVAEGEPLPAALVELVRDSPISSIEDLQLLLLSDSVDEEGNSAAGHRSPRSLDAQPAQQALCKVRTEVVEVTRSMLDRSNANFLLWPPCVEVQRCSGCCNAKSLQCVPFRTNTRYLQVMKVEYINKSPTYAKAVVSVVDHVECRCQSAPALKRKSPRRQNGPHKEQHQNQTVSHGPVKTHSKDELHHHDGLKHNQGSHLQDLLQHHWSTRGDTFTHHEGFSLVEKDSSQPGEPALYAPHWRDNSTGQLQKNGKTSEGNKSAERGGVEVVEMTGELLPSGTVGKEGVEADDSQANSRSWRQDKSTLLKPVTPQDKPNPFEATASRILSRFRPTKEPNPEPRRGNDTPEEEEVILELEKRILEQERRELLMLHQRLDQEKELLRQKKKEDDEHTKHHLHTTQRPETTTTAKAVPAAPAAPRPPAQPKRRMRKNRRRISKAAMRAMLM